MSCGKAKKNNKDLSNFNKHYLWAGKRLEELGQKTLALAGCFGTELYLI